MTRLTCGPTVTTTGLPSDHEQVRVYHLMAAYRNREAAEPIDWAAEAAVWGRDTEEWAEEAWQAADPCLL